MVVSKSLIHPNCKFAVIVVNSSKFGPIVILFDLFHFNILVLIPANLVFELKFARLKIIHFDIRFLMTSPDYCYGSLGVIADYHGDDGVYGHNSLRVK